MFEIADCSSEKASRVSCAASAAHPVEQFAEAGYVASPGVPVALLHEPAQRLVRVAMLQ